jgi:hypothetical protein
MLIEWVINSWAAVPDGLLQKGMEDLILTPATAPQPPSIVSPLVPPIRPVSDVASEGQVAALSILDTLDQHIVLPVELPDEIPDPTEAEESERIPSLCMHCERPLRLPNAVKCPPQAFVRKR